MTSKSNPIHKYQIWVKETSASDWKHAASVYAIRPKQALEEFNKSNSVAWYDTKAVKIPS